MTTIAADARMGVMVADSMVSDGDVKTRMTKIHRHGECLIGIAGELPEIERWLKWYRAGKTGAKPKITTLGAIELGPDGVNYYSGLDRSRCESGFHAIGTGGKAALALMTAGHTAQESVEVACLVDSGSSLPIQIELLTPICASRTEQ